jgi:aminopeptidase-like protein
MYKWLTELFPINRSLTGVGVRETLTYLKGILSDLKIHVVPSGTQAYDWTVPDEWTIRNAFIEDEKGNRIIDFKKNNLHVVGYSEPVDKWLTLDEMDQYLYTLPDQANAIPYVTSYYKKRWGFCLSYNQKISLKPGKYHVFIDSDLKPGVMNYGEIILPGKTKQEILLSTYICHPSLANDELSGPVVTTALAKWLQGLKYRRYTYRIVYIPENIGAIYYISRNLNQLKKNVIAGYQIACVGDDRKYSFLPSRNGHTLADRTAKHVLKHAVDKFEEYTFLERGSDERQYCSPGVDLPVASIMRSKYGTYPEYHTSLDNLEFVSETGLQGAFIILQKVIEALENNCIPKVNVLCEPQLGKRGLYPTISQKGMAKDVHTMMNLISYSDGTRDLIEIAEIIGEPIWEIFEIVKKLVSNGIVTKV